MQKRLQKRRGTMTILLGSGFLVAANNFYKLWSWTLSTIPVDDLPLVEGISKRGSILEYYFEHLPEVNRTRFVPGIYKYGSNNSVLIITGASITTDYDSPETLWFQFFALGNTVFGDNAFKYPNGIPCRENLTLDSNEKLHMKKWENGELDNEDFLCRVGNRTAKLDLIPSESYDGNTAKVIQVWRCPLHSIISRYDVRHFLRHSIDEKDLTPLLLTVDIVYNESAHLGSVTQMQILNTAPFVGLNEVQFNNEKTPLSTRHNITLCTVSHPNGLSHLSQFIRYHHDVIGIDHIYLGLFTQPEVWQNDDVILQAARNLFRREIDAGALSISSLWDEENLGHCDNSEIVKQTHYFNCLYRAKSTSQFVATWDIDEFFVFKDNQEQRSLPDFLRGINHPACEDWSFITMKSSSAGGSWPAGAGPTGLVALDFPLRENETNDVWQKSVGRTKNMFHNGFHLPGSSLPQGKSNVMRDTSAQHPSHGECAFYTDEAFMVHMRGIMAPGSRLGLKEPTVTNELVHLLTFDSGI